MQGSANSCFLFRLMGLWGIMRVWVDMKEGEAGAGEES